MTTPIYTIRKSGRPTVQQVHVNRPLSQISIAYKNDAYIAEQVFPVVPVEKKSDLYFIFDTSFFRNRSGPRAPGTRAPVGDYGLTTASYICMNDSFAKTVDDEVLSNADVPLRPMATAVNYVTDALALGLEVRVAGKLSACSNWYGASALTAGATWLSDSSDPFANIDDAVNTVVTQTSRYPNTMVTSWSVWKRLRNHPAFLERIKYARPGGKIEYGDLQNWFGVDKILVGRSIYDPAQEGQTASPQFVWGNYFWVGYVPQAPALEEPAAGYVFRWGNREVRTFRLDPEHSYFIEAQWFTAEVITASTAGTGIYNCI